MKWLDNCIHEIACVFEIYILFDFFFNSFKVRDLFRKKIAQICIVILLSGVVYYINSYDSTLVNLIFVPIIYLFLISLVFKGNYIMKLSYYIIANLILFGSEILVAVFLSLPSETVPTSTIINQTNNSIKILLMKMLSFILFIIVKRIIKEKGNRMSVKIFFMYLTVPISTFCIMISIFYMNFDYDNNSFTKIFLVISLAFMLIGNALIFYGFNSYSVSIEKHTIQDILLSKQNIELKYYEQISIIDHKHDELIHNINHYLKAIGDLAIRNQNTKIINVLEELQVEFQKTETLTYSSNQLLNALLSDRKAVAEKNNIEYDVYIEPGFDITHVQDTDYIAMFGNLIDNAIEAAGKCEKGKVIIRMFMQNEGGFCILKISNNVCGQVVISNNKFVSTKNDGKKHGIGILSVQNMAKKYGGYLENLYDNHNFTSVLVIPSKDDSENEMSKI